ncbi:MAG: rod shape-determining protein MreD [Anaerolineaceae bacterium]|nr:rod shape-determining protein MreD [Anaerolineaceae bacterium]
MGSFLSLPVLILVASIQASVTPHIRFWDGAPDLVFLFVLSWSIHAPLDESVVWALVGGIFQDLLSVAPLGLSSVGMVLAVFAVHYLSHQVNRIGFFWLTALTLAGSLFQQMMVWLLFAMLGFTMSFLDDFNFVIVPTIIYNLALIWPIYAVSRWLQRRFAVSRRIES